MALFPPQPGKSPGFVRLGGAECVLGSELAQDEHLEQDSWRESLKPWAIWAGSGFRSSLSLCLKLGPEGGGPGRRWTLSLEVSWIMARSAEGGRYGLAGFPLTPCLKSGEAGPLEFRLRPEGPHGGGACSAPQRAATGLEGSGSAGVGYSLTGLVS